jgi:hypothetical protein
VAPARPPIDDAKGALIKGFPGTVLQKAGAEQGARDVPLEPIAADRVPARERRTGLTIPDGAVHAVVLWPDFLAIALFE